MLLLTSEDCLPYSSLGPLTYLRIWHDNSGPGGSASWYCNYIIVRDIQTNTKTIFLINKWFALEEDDGQVCYRVYIYFSVNLRLCIEKLFNFYDTMMSS